MVLNYYPRGDAVLMTDPPDEELNIALENILLDDPN